MIERRTMWLVECSLNMHQVEALYDLKKNEVVCEHYSGDDYDGDDDWYKVQNGERFFNTEQEAREYRALRIEEAREKMNTCMALIEELDRLEPADDFQFERKDYLGGYATSDGRHGYYYEQYKKYEKEASLLATIARSRHFNANGRTILIDEVIGVRWYKDKATLVLRGGDSITTISKEEFEIVELMFGSNRSGMYY